MLDYINKLLKLSATDLIQLVICLLVMYFFLDVPNLYEKLKEYIKKD